MKSIKRMAGFDLVKSVRVVASDLSLGKNYIETRDEYRELLGVK